MALAGSSCGSLVDTDFKVVLDQLPSNFFDHDIFSYNPEHTCMYTNMYINIHICIDLRKYRLQNFLQSMLNFPLVTSTCDTG